MNYLIILAKNGGKDRRFSIMNLVRAQTYTVAFITVIVLLYISEYRLIIY